MNNKLYKQLEDLKEKDVSIRSKLMREGKLYGQYDIELQNVHIDNAHALNGLVSLYGWPTISMVGIEGTRLAWLIAQHSICTPALQRKFYTLLSVAADDDDIPMRQVVLLADRIRFNEGRPQLYGTVLDWNEHGEFTCKLEDPECVNERRQAVGMPTFEHSLQIHKDEVMSEGNKPPVDYQAYENAIDVWAKKIGWR